MPDWARLFKSLSRDNPIFVQLRMVNLVSYVRTLQSKMTASTACQWVKIKNPQYSQAEGGICTISVCSQFEEVTKLSARSL
jgi:hypothetical protein